MAKSKKSPGTASLKVNFFYNTLYRISGIIVPLITTPYVSRVLGAENSGIYSYTYTIAWYFCILGCFGFENYGNRLVATIRGDQKKLNQVFSSLFALQVITALVANIGYLIYLLLFCQKYIFLSYLSSLYVISAFFNINWLYFGLEQFKKTALRTIFTRFLGLVLIFLFVHTSEDLWIYVLILAAMELINQLILWVNINRYVSFVRVTFKEIFAHFKGSLILFMPVVLINIYRMMDKLMLGEISTMAEVGYYNYADKITELPFHIITAVGTVMLPRTSNLIANGKAELSKKYIERTMVLNTYFSCAFSFGLSAVSYQFSILFFGPDYARCALLIVIMAPMLIVRAWANVGRTQYLIPNHKDREYIISLIIGVILNLTLNFLLIPRIGAAGAAVATLIAESSVAGTQILFTARELPVKKYLLPSLPFIGFGLIMFVLLKVIDSIMPMNWPSLILQILIGAALYLLLSTKYLIKADPNIVKEFKRHFKLKRNTQNS